MDKSILKDYARKLDEFYVSARRMPSYSEMLGIFGFKSKNAVFKRISQLVKEGMLTKDKTGRLVPLKLQQPVRILGLVQAGFPSPAEEETVDLISIDEYLISNPQATFLLKVEGDSMIDSRMDPRIDHRIAFDVPFEGRRRFYDRCGDPSWRSCLDPERTYAQVRGCCCRLRG
jgi:hypothetical protein